MKTSTETKIKIARFISKVIVGIRSIFGLSPIVRVERRGVRWSLDLREGIDLAIYLGVYEPETIKALQSLVKSGDIVLDIGANIGAITLPLANLVGVAGQVIVFEPTAWAYGKLEKNLSLNSNLIDRIKAEQIMLLDEGKEPPSLIYSSWSLVNEEDELTHPTHKGRLMTTDGVRGISLDRYIEENSVEKIDLIKLDVDGYELDVIKGASKTLSRYSPRIILELAPHVQEEKEQLEDLLFELKSANYRLEDLTSRKPIAMKRQVIEKLCPEGGGINVLAIPQAN
ncbi:MAG: FkbM family methyltransferase [Snowella sp.]|nr:FkbM family methyltransferase [Snowella sp.]